MAWNTNISWADATFNPWIGCQRVSAACDHCYAETFATTRLGRAWGPKAPRVRTSPSNWRQPLAWQRRAVREGWRPRVFCASLADVFDNQVPHEWRADLWNLVAATPALDWLLLTKRPGNIARMLPDGWGDGWPHVWLGLTVEEQARAGEIDKLRAVPAAVRFLSCEPLLGPLDLDLTEVHWVIAGGESGPGWRPMNLAWARDIQAQCRRMGAAFHFKQVAASRPTDAMIPADLTVRQWPTRQLVASGV